VSDPYREETRFFIAPDTYARNGCDNFSWQGPYVPGRKAGIGNVLSAPFETESSDWQWA
jgi:hypothetical protein